MIDPALFFATFRSAKCHTKEQYLKSLAMELLYLMDFDFKTDILGNSKEFIL